FQYRFGQGVGLDGHSFGNLFIAAMTGVTGDFAQAIRQSSKVLAVRGRVLPSTMQSVTLCAEVAGAQHQIQGESQIPRAGAPIERVFLQPDDVRGYGEAVQALLGAEVIVVGPGSLYTSILPNLLVRDIAAAIRASDAIKVYVCNVATQPGETDGYTVVDHVRAIESHVGNDLFDYVLANNRLDVTLPTTWNSVMVQPGEGGTVRTWSADVVDLERPWRHDPAKLASELLKIQAGSKARR
ncbi:MAG TPA: YvcK family protein, partial [Anaerolineae bacterium]|nr:YvcK family protein [Anaerolineae bacterium]